MQRKKPEVDVIKDVLEESLAAFPHSVFIQSLLHQYIERGGLSKKQLQGLHHKASKVAHLSPGKLATLEAVILKKPTRYKSELPQPTPLYQKDQRTGQLIGEILEKYPAHKRVMFFKTRFDNHETLSSSDIAEIERFYKLLNKA